MCASQRRDEKDTKTRVFFPPHSKAATLLPGKDPTRGLPSQEPSDRFTTTGSGGEGSVLVCRKPQPKKENFKVGRGGEKGFLLMPRNPAWRENAPRNDTLALPRAGLQAEMPTESWDCFLYSFHPGRWLSSVRLYRKLETPFGSRRTRARPSAGRGPGPSPAGTTYLV